jgi:CelD/BcsL family acetyltransferase involved in cellulose biosynthesis
MIFFPRSSPDWNRRVLTELREFERVATEWKQLFARSNVTSFQSPEWLLPWLEVFSARELVGIAVRNGDVLAGFAPLLIYPRDGERVLAFAGGGVSDYLGVLAERGRELQVIEEILGTALEIPGWTILDLTDVAQSSTLLGCPCLAKCAKPQETCLVLPLPETRAGLLGSFSKRQRANLRQARSRLQRAGDATVELATIDTIPQFLDDLFRLHASRWKEMGESGVLGELRVRQFHRRVAPRLCAEGVLRLDRLRLKGKTIAVTYSLSHDHEVYCYLQGFDPAFAQLSPGTLLMQAVIEDAMTRGIRRFDFLRGEEAYKTHWRPLREHTYRIEVPRSELATQLRSSLQQCVCTPTGKP